MSREALQAEVAVRQRRYLGASRSQRPPFLDQGRRPPTRSTPHPGTVRQQWGPGQTVAAWAAAPPNCLEFDPVDHNGGRHPWPVLLPA